MVRAETASDSTAPAGMVAAIPVMAVVFLFFASVGMTLPVLPLHVHDVLRFGPAIVGLVAGAQFIAALGSRFWAGSLADTKGPKYAMLLGLVGAAAGSLCYLGSLMLLAAPVWSTTLLVVGRGLLGGAESLVITGGMLWGLGLVAPDRSAKIIALVGMSMFAAMAIGAPIGAIIYAHLAFAGIAGVTLLLSLASVAVIARLRPYVPAPGPKGRWTEVLGAVAWPGVGFALSGITFGAVTAFLTLYFALQGWGNGPIAFTIFAGALIVTRLIAGELPDRFGGARVAVWSLVVQVVGLAMIGMASSELIAMVGALVAGAGFSLVFPSLGLEAVQRAPAKNRGLAMGTYNAFLDLTLGLGSPALGWLGGATGLGSVFVASSVAALLAIPIAIGLQRKVGPTTYSHSLERSA